MPPFIRIFYHSSIILSILIFKLNSFVNFFALLYNIVVKEKEKNTNKAENASKKPSKNRKLLMILIPVIVGVVLVLTACLLAVFLSKPGQAGEVEIKSYDRQVFVKTKVEEDQRTYRFKFTANGKSVVISSESNMLEITQDLLDDKLHLGTTYDVQVCYVDPSGILAGDYGKATSFTPTLRLANTSIALNDEDGKTISWQSVEYADFYNVCYYDGSMLEKIKTTQTSFDLSAIKGGQRQVFVTSVSNRMGLRESEKSNIVSLNVTHQMKAFTSGTVDKVTKRVSIISPESVDGIVLTDLLNNVEYNIVDFTVAKSADRYVITFSINLIYTTDDQTFSVKPLADAYNLFSGEAIELRVI